MSKHQILIDNSLGKKLTKFSPSDRKKIHKILTGLASDPLPKGRDLKKLRSTASTAWRIRIGDLRIIYSLTSDQQTIKIVDIDFRGNIY